ncbi:MAG: PAS-domain containing protein [Rhodospirillaceae bacterium]
MDIQVVVALLLGVGLGLLMAAGPLWWLWRRLDSAHGAVLNASGLLAAALGTSPATGCCWRAGAEAGGPLFIAADFAPLLGATPIELPEDIGTALVAADAVLFNAAFATLRQDGCGFRLEVVALDGMRRLVLSGQRHIVQTGYTRSVLGTLRHIILTAFSYIVTGTLRYALQGSIRYALQGCIRYGELYVVWQEDATVVTAERARADAALAALFDAVYHREVLQAALDTLPVPVWLRRDDLSLSWCNRAYAAAFDAEPEAVIRAGNELGAGRALAMRVRASGSGLSESRRVVIGCDRHMIEVTESPLILPTRNPVAVPILGFAVNRTREEGLRADLARHVSAHAAVLEQLGSAIAVFGADRRLSFYNQAYIRLWGLDEGWLASLPSFGEVLEELRTRRRLPEYANFLQFKKENVALFTQLIEPREDLLHLPDGTTVRELVVPHSFGGLMFVLEDVTTTLALESSYNILMAVQRETLDNLSEAIAVFGSDGRLKLSNPSYAAVWGLAPCDLEGEPHIATLLERIRPLVDLGGDWAGFKDEMVAATLERTARSGQLERTDGSMLDFAYVPLPDGAVLTTYLDVTDTVRVEQALRVRNAALDEADRLKTEFLTNVSYHLRTPLNSIMGFSEMLSNQYFGQLNPRQLEYSRAVQSSGAALLAMIDDIRDLAIIEAGYMILERRSVDIGGLLAGVGNLAQEWTAKKSMRLELDCPEDIGSIDADEKRLKQALFNLISNAIRVSPWGGTITLAARRSPDAVVLTVRDAGASVVVGGNPRRMERFEPPSPFGSGRRNDNAGLGLTLVKSFIELHGGQIVVDGASGQGTSIHCILPIELNAEGLAPQHAACGLSS